MNLNIAGRRKLGFSSEYKTIYDAFTIKPSISIAKQQNIFVKALVDSGIWAKLDVFYLLAGHTNDNGESLINWINPGTFNGTAVNSPVFTALEGFTGDALTKYIKTNYVPSINGINFTLNSASLLCYARLDTGLTLKVLLGGGTIPASQLITGSMFYADINNGNGKVGITNVNTKGFFATSRLASNLVEFYNNSTKYISTEASTAVQNDELWILARSGTGIGDAFTDNQISMIGIGAGLTTAEKNIINNAFEIYMDSNGKGVVP